MTDRSRPLVLLDRDGVINRDSAEYIKNVSEWVALPGSLEAIARLTRAGCNVAVVTNQSGIGRGLFDLETLDAIHAAMIAAVADAGGTLNGIYFCPHIPGAGCDCRKPKPGMLLRAMDELADGEPALACIGDKTSDVEAARAAGIRPILIRPGADADPDAAISVFPDLASAVDALLGDGSFGR